MARKSGWKGKNPSTITKRMAKYTKILEREMSDAIGLATYTVRDYAKKLTYQARNVSASDSITGKARKSAGQSPVRTKVDRTEMKGQVSAIPYYTYARTRGLAGLFTRFGRRNLLAREGLVVTPSKRGNYLQRKAALKGKRPRLVRFSEDPALKKWATARKMLSHQKIYMSEPEMIHSLITRPALRKNTKKIRGLYEAAFVTAGGRF